MLFRDLRVGAVRPGYGFVPKRLGWGAVPATWQGWVATAVFVAVAAAVGNLAAHRSPVWAALLVPVVGGFIWLSWVKTDGDWRWHWGRDRR